MADAPSPYAPSAVGNEVAAAPRPASRPILFLIATFAMTVIGPMALYRPWFDHATADRRVLATVVAIPSVLSIAWAFLSDAVPIMNTRREGYLLAAALLGVICWLAVLLVGEDANTMLALGIALAVAVTVARVATVGALVEIGQRRGATGRLAAALAAAGHGAIVAMTPVWPLLDDDSLAAYVAIGAGLPAFVVVLLVAMPEPGGDRPPVAIARVRIRSFLRSRAFWGTCAVIALAAGHIPDAAFTIGRKAAEVAGLTRNGEIAQLIAPLASVAVYALTCRRFRFATLLRLALLAKVLSMIAVLLLWNRLSASSYAYAMVAQAVGSGLVFVAISDLIMRAAPPGREAFGFMLFSGVEAVAAAVMTPLTMRIGFAVPVWAMVAAGATVAAVLAVWLLAPAVVARREGEGAPP